MKPVKFIRKGKTITTLADEENDIKRSAHECKSVNEARKFSRNLQMEHDGALGRGSVKVET